MKVQLTRHAVERYQERVKPAMDAAHAEQELECLCGDLVWTQYAPAGMAEDGLRLYAEMGVGIWAAGVETADSVFVRTVLLEKALRPAERMARNKRRKLIRQAKRRKREGRREWRREEAA
jgi:hypothetical protein